MPRSKEVLDSFAAAIDDELVDRVSILVREPAASSEELRAALSSLRARLAQLAAEGEEHEGSGEPRRLAQLTELVQQALAARRVARAEDRAQRFEQRWPVERDLLIRLTSRPATPTELTRALGRRGETISRRLKALLKDGLVTAVSDPGDGRRRVYALTPSGEAQAANLLAFGTPRSAPKPVVAQVAHDALEEALAAAIALRRQTSRRDDALQRLMAISAHARMAVQPDVALHALSEIIVTLRQAGRTDELEPHATELAQIARGTHSQFPQTMVLPATASLEYELGRRADGDLVTRAGHLVTAATLFARFAACDTIGRWRNRQGWALVGLADNLRQQSRPSQAIEEATAASQIFGKLGDPYGVSRSQFVIGFCLRLRGQFIEADAHLEHAHELATRHGYQAFTADCRMQLGEVRRCLGDFDAATTFLTDAQQRATHLGLPLTRAFAESSLAAVAQARGERHEALQQLSTAGELFEQRQYSDGLALNHRRTAVVLRLAATNAKGFKEAEQHLTRARDMYEEIESPAGVVACIIEAGQLALARKRDARPHCDQLMDHISPIGSSEWDMLERDPWVPAMLVDFATAACHERLHATAQSLLEARTTILAELEAKTELPNASQVPGTPRNKPPVDPMAGEHRRLPKLASAIAPAR